MGVVYCVLFCFADDDDDYYYDDDGGDDDDDDNEDEHEDENEDEHEDEDEGDTLSMLCSKFIPFYTHNSQFKVYRATQNSVLVSESRANTAK